MKQPSQPDPDEPIDDAELGRTAALASDALQSSSNVQAPRKRSPTPTDYREQAMYEPVGFGEFGRYMRNKRAKLQVQNRDLVQQAEGLPQFFRGLRVYINGYTEQITLPELQNLLILHGGIYVPYLDQKTLVTHIIATNLTPSKRHEFRSYKIATPDWLVESARAGRLLDWRDYSLLAPLDPPSVRLDHETLAATGARAAEDAARVGTQTGQRSLFSMGVGKNKAPSTETRETLAERGARLAKEALEVQAAAATAASSKSAGGLGAFFSSRAGQDRSAGSPKPSRLMSRPTTPTKKDSAQSAAGPEEVSTPERTAAKLPATTDSAEKPNAITHSWLPQAPRSERQNALLSDQDWLMKHTSSSPDFLAGYFAQSRLHLISTFKEELKMLASSMQQSLPPRKKKLTGRISDGRTIFHVDFDCFFVSAGLTTRPELRGKPVAVCHARGNTDAASSTSEIASCSYEARACGVRNGMSLGRARELCPEIQTMPFEFELYKRISMAFYAILLKHSSFLQAVSIDEVLMEVKIEPTILREHDPALNLAHRIREEILEATGCQASIGVSHNVLLAKLATRKAKPANAYHLFAEEVEDFIAPLGVDELPGIGWSLRDKLKSQLGVETVGDLRKTPAHKLAKVIGAENGRKFAAYSHGIDERELDLGKARQSVSTEVNYGIRFPPERHDLVERFVRQVGVETAKRVREQGLQARQLTLKVMQRHPEAPVEAPKMLGHGWCTTDNKVSTLAGRNGGATDDGDIVGETAWKLMKSLQAPPHELRGIAVQLSKLEKDGVPVDQVLEKGQSRLTFRTARRGPVLAEPVQPDTGSDPVASITRTQVPNSPPPAPHRRSSTETVTISSSPKDQSDKRLPESPISNAPGRGAAPAVNARALRKEPSAIVLDETDDESVAAGPAPIRAAGAASLGPLRKSSRRRRTPEPVIPFMFRPTKKSLAPPPPTASQVGDLELLYYGIDPEVYRSLERRLRDEVLADARRSKPAPSKAKLRQWAQERTTVTSEAHNKLSKAPPAPPEVIVLPPSPSEISDSQIAAMGYDPTVFRDLGAKTQREHAEFARQRQARLVVGNLSRHTRGDGIGPSAGGQKSRPRAPVKHVNVRQPPRFGGKVDIEDIEDRVEAWVCAARDGAPDADDLDKLGRYLEKCAMRDKGHDLKKATDVLAWWSYVIEIELGKRGQAEGTVALWWDGYERVRERLEWLVLKETGCQLRM